ncbi:MAG: hypothetical protein WCG08_02395 [Paludibacter sp.]
MKVNKSNLIIASNLTFLLAAINVILFIIHHIILQKWVTVDSIEKHGTLIVLLVVIGLLIRHGYKWVKYYFIIGMLSQLYWYCIFYKNPPFHSDELTFGKDLFSSLSSVINFSISIAIIFFLSRKESKRN